MYPKIELHVHLEGTISPSLAEKLAKRNHTTLPMHRISPNKQHYISSDFLDFLKAYDEISELINAPEDYYDITYDYLSTIAQSGVLYAELMYSPSHAEKISKVSSHLHLKAIESAIDDVRKSHHIIGKIILTGVRHFGIEDNFRILRDFDKHRNEVVVGFGLGGDECGYPPELFKQVYELADEIGLKSTIHAGEFDSFERMQFAITHLPISRIGHGIAAIDDKKTCDLLIEKKIALELCPTSNVFLKRIPSIEKHPIKAFYDMGVRISINSDDPPFMNANVGNEYALVQKAFQWSDATMKNISKMAIEDSFASEEEKKILLRHFE